MRRWLACIILSFVTLGFLQLEVSAEKIMFNALWQKQFEYDGYSVDTTSEGHLLNVAYTLVEGREEMIFDYYLLDEKTGDILHEIHALDGYSYVFKSPANKVYVIAYETEQQTLTLYNEQLEKQWSQELPGAAFADVTYHEFVDDSFLFYAGNNLIPTMGFNIEGESLAFPAIFSYAPSVEQCPGEIYCEPATAMDVLITDPVRDIHKTVTLHPNLPEDYKIMQTLPAIYQIERYFTSGWSVDFEKPDRYFLFIGAENEQYEVINQLVEFDVDGNIVRELTLPTFNQYFDLAMTGDIFAFAYDDTYARYSLEDFSIISEDTLAGSINYISLDIDASKLVADEALYLLDEDLTLAQKIDRPGEFYNGIKKLSKYIIVRSINENEPSFVYDSNTLAFIATVKNAHDYIDTNDGTDIISYTSNPFNYTYELTYFNYQLLPIYDQYKAWTITFSGFIDPKSVDEHTVYVKNERGEKVNMKLMVKRNQVQIIPAGGYVPGFLYTLHVEPGIKTRSGKSLSQATTKTFIVE